MTVIVELVPSQSRTTDGRKMFDVVQVKPYDQAPQPHGSKGNHGRHKDQVIFTASTKVNPGKASQYTPNPTY